MKTGLCVLLSGWKESEDREGVELKYLPPHHWHKELHLNQTPEMFVEMCCSEQSSRGLTGSFLWFHCCSCRTNSGTESHRCLKKPLFNFDEEDW